MISRGQRSARGLYRADAMRTKTLLRVAIVGLFMALMAPLASAERVKTTQATKVMKRPGESSAVVTRVKAGRTLTVIAKQNRWYKVRVNGRTGWVARSTVKSASAREVPRNTRRRPFVDGRSTRRGWGGEAPEDRVGGDAIEDEQEEVARPKKKAKKKARPVRDDDEEDFEDEDDGDQEVADSEDCEDDDCEEASVPAQPKERVAFVSVSKVKLLSKPSKKGKSRGRAKKGARVVVLEEKKGWLLVENGQGDSGWVRASDLEEPGARKQRSFQLDARIGFERLGQNFRTTGADQASELRAYDIQAAAAAINLRADVVQKYKKNYLIGVELRADLAKSAPGIRYQTVDIPYTTYDVDLRALAGYDFHHKTGAAAFGHLGYHYGMFQVANTGDFAKNLARLPSETVAGPTVGIGAEMPRITDKIGARISADYLVLGKRAQTIGLEDGQISDITSLWAGATVSYRWKKSMNLDVAYGYDYSKTVWTGAAVGSMRGHNATAAARKDVTHALTIGIAKTF